MLLRGATVVDGTGAAPRADTPVLIEGERIAAVGSDAEARTIPGTRVLDVAGRTILPGLIDLHVHSSFPSELTGYLTHGVTSIRFAGIDLPAWRSISARAAAADPVGPRLFNLGPMLDRPAGAWPMWTQSFETTEEAARAGAALIDDEGTDGPRRPRSASTRSPTRLGSPRAASTRASACSRTARSPIGWRSCPACGSASTGRPRRA
jgi:hypothetical protein